MAAVKPDSKATTSSFHEMLRTVYENNKNDVNEDQKKTIRYDDHIEDPFHPNNIFNRTQNFPTVGNPHAARCAAERILLSDSGQLLDLSDQEGHAKAAKLLFLSQANTFQHKMLMQLGNKLMKSKELEKPTERDTEEAVFSKNQKEQLVFERYDETTVIDKSVILPTNWTVVQISATDFLVSRFRSLKAKQPLSSNPSLTLVRMSGGRVRVGRCEGPSDQGISFMKECQQIQEQFVTIVKEYSNSVKNDGKNLKKAKEKESYWSERFNLEGRLKSLVESIENSWLGYEKAALLGTLVREEDRNKVRSVMKDCITTDMKESQSTFIQQLLSATPFLTEQQIRQGLLQKVSSLDEDEVEKLIKVARSQLSCLSESRRHPVILILDKETQGLPWESLPCLRSCRQAVSRVPSVPFLYCLWSAHNSSQDSVLTEGVAQDNVFYVLNPDKSLGKTEEKMKEVLKRETCSNWEGVVGQVPQKVQLTKALQEKDCFMYCGHGSGSQYLSGDEIERLRVRGVPLLFGCSSGHLERMGRTLDPLGVSQSYLIGTSPALVGFLWAVTDNDLDNWTAVFLDHWLGGKEAGEEELLQAVADKRMDFERFTNSAALVVYGLPIKAREIR